MSELWSWLNVARWICSLRKCRFLQTRARFSEDSVDPAHSTHNNMETNVSWSFLTSSKHSSRPLLPVWSTRWLSSTPKTTLPLFGLTLITQNKCYCCYSSWSFHHTWMRAWQAFWQEEDNWRKVFELCFQNCDGLGWLRIVQVGWSWHVPRPFGSRAMSVQGVSNCLTSSILLRGRSCLLTFLFLNLSLRSTVRYLNCGFVGSRPLSNLLGGVFGIEVVG